MLVVQCQFLSSFFVNATNTAHFALCAALEEQKLQASTDSLEKSKAAASAAKEEAAKEQASMQSSFEKLQKDKASAEMAAEKAEKENESLKTSLVDMERKAMEDALDRANKAESALVDSSKKCSDLEGELDHLSTGYEDLEGKLANVKKIVQYLEDTYCESLVSNDTVLKNLEDFKDGGIIRLRVEHEEEVRVRVSESLRRQKK